MGLSPNRVTLKLVMGAAQLDKCQSELSVLPCEIRSWVVSANTILEILGQTDQETPPAGVATVKDARLARRTEVSSATGAAWRLVRQEHAIGRASGQARKLFVT